jgi:hypothetical protein
VLFAVFCCGCAVFCGCCIYVYTCVAVWGLFLHGCSQVAKQKGNDNRVLSFLGSLKIFGTIFILAVPAVVTFASLIIAP